MYNESLGIAYDSITYIFFIKLWTLHMYFRVLSLGCNYGKQGHTWQGPRIESHTVINLILYVIYDRRQQDSLSMLEVFECDKKKIINNKLLY